MAPISSTAVTRIGPRLLGRICPRMICAEELPASRAAAIKSALFKVNVRLRAIRAYLGQLTAASAITALVMPPFNSAAIAMAITSPGNAKHTSAMRITAESRIPPQKPHITPAAVPVTVIITTRVSAEATLVFNPIKILESISRPKRSVPAGWARLGGCNERLISCRLGS